MNTGHLMMFGCGRMGSALLSQWLAGKHWQGAFTVVKPTPGLPETIRADRGVIHAESLASIAGSLPPALVVLAVKPQVMGQVLADCAEHLPADTLYFTIAAGLRLSFYAERLGPEARVIRLMPNIPTQIGLGMTTLFAAPKTKADDRATAEALMRAVGEVVWCGSEEEMDAATAISGSGPAYVFYFMECLISAAIDAGLNAATARVLVGQTVRGAGELACRSGAPLSELRRDVTSPGGTTEAALSRLMSENGMLQLTHATVQAAIKKSRELVADAQ